LPVEAGLSEVFKNDACAFNIVECTLLVIWSTKRAIAEAFFSLVISGTGWAAPSDISGMEVHVALELRGKFSEFLNEGKSFTVVGAEEEINLNLFHECFDSKLG